MQTAPGLGPAGEGSSRPATRPPPTLDEVMRAPSTTVPEVVVLNQMPPGLTHKEEVPDPKEDLWISTSDGYVCHVSPSIVLSLQHSLGNMVAFTGLPDAPPGEGWAVHGADPLVLSAAMYTAVTLLTSYIPVATIVQSSRSGSA